MSSRAPEKWMIEGVWWSAHELAGKAKIKVATVKERLRAGKRTLAELLAPPHHDGRAGVPKPRRVDPAEQAQIDAYLARPRVRW